MKCDIFCRMAAGERPRILPTSISINAMKMYVAKYMQSVTEGTYVVFMKWHTPQIAAIVNARMMMTARRFTLRVRVLRDELDATQLHRCTTTPYVWRVRCAGGIGRCSPGPMVMLFYESCANVS